MRGWYRQYQTKDQNKMILESRGQTLLTINDRLAALPLKVCLHPPPFLPSNRVICRLIACDSNTGKTNYPADRLTHHWGSSVARGSCCRRSCSSVHLGGDQVEAGAIARCPGQVPIHPWRGQAKCPWGVRSLHRQRVPQTESWRTERERVRVWML